MLSIKGIKISVTAVAKISPNTKDTAAGLRYCACSEVSLNKGNSPQTVVIVVKILP